jgi:sulfate adenylyltransferase subunit 2
MGSPVRRAQSHLDWLENEAITIIREVAAEYDNPCLFYSIGKDSTVLLHLARKAFYPAAVPFTLLHIDTTWEFQEMGRFRDAIAERYGLRLKVYINQKALDQGVHPIRSGSIVYNNMMKTEALKQAVDAGKYDAALGGARRDEEASRAKERVFSVRDANHRWQPKSQRPELWNVYNTRLLPKETMRVFPLSNWTELDIWQYIYREKVDIVDLYFARERLSWIDADSGSILALDDERMLEFLTDDEKKTLKERKIRFRTLGCYPQTGAVESEAEDLLSVIGELIASRSSERQGRLLDKDQSASMEKKKREGYF